MTLEPIDRAAASGSRHATSASAGSRPRRRSRIAPPTTYECGPSLASAGKRRVSSSRHDITQHADAFDFDLDGVAGIEQTDAETRPGQNHVSQQQRPDQATELEEESARETKLR